MTSRSNPESRTEPGFDMRDDGRVKTNWKTLAVVISSAAIAGGAYFKLQDHDRRLLSAEAKMDSIVTLLLEIRTDVRAGNGRE